jgi:Bucentaur or craniofacial development
MTLTPAATLLLCPPLFALMQAAAGGTLPDSRTAKSASVASSVFQAGLAEGSGGEPCAPAVQATAKVAAVDDVWAQMNRPVKKKVAARVGSAVAPVRTDSAMAGWLGVSKPQSKATPKQTTNHSVDKTLVGWLGSSSDTASAAESGSRIGSGQLPTKVLRLDDVLKNQKDAPAEEDDGGRKRKGGTGLEGLLSSIKGTKQASVLDRTRDAWSGLKANDAEVADELDAYKKDKNRYTDKVAFLDRTDKREWEADMERKRRR